MSDLDFTPPKLPAPPPRAPVVPHPPIEASRRRNPEAAKPRPASDSTQGSAATRRRRNESPSGRTAVPQKLTVILPGELREWLRALASATGRKQHTIVTEALDHYLDAVKAQADTAHVGRKRAEVASASQIGLYNTELHGRLRAAAEHLSMPVSDLVTRLLEHYRSHLDPAEVEAAITAKLARLTTPN